MDQGPPRVALHALLKLAGVLDEMSGRQPTGSSWDVQHPRRSPVPRKHPPSPSQLRLSFEADRDQPPKAPPSAALLEALAELLLAAMGMMTVTTGSGEASDERRPRVSGQACPS